MSVKKIAPNLIANNSIVPASANIGLVDNANTNPRGLYFSDMRYRAGRTRIEVYSIVETDEFIDGKVTYKIATGIGPKGFRDKIRFVGASWRNWVDANGGAYVGCSVEGDYVMITDIMDDIAILYRSETARGDNIDVIVDGADTGTNLAMNTSNVFDTYNIRHQCILSDSSISAAMGGLGLHTVKFIAGDTGSTPRINMHGFDVVCTTPYEEAGSASIYGGDFSRQVVADPTINGNKGAIAYRYINGSGERAWATQEPDGATLETTLTSALNNGTAVATVSDTTDFVVDDLVLLKDTSLGYTISQLFRILSIDSATQMTFTANAARTTQAGASHNFAIGSEIKHHGKCNTAVDHSNEQIKRSYHPRIFGAGHTSDWQAATGTSAYSFVLDDGITSFWTNEGAVGSAATQVIEQKGMIFNDTSTSAFIFTGTGFAMQFNTREEAALADNVDIYVDGVLVFSGYNATAESNYILDICSGLPYGSHMVRFVVNDTGTGDELRYIVRLIEYESKTPSAISSINEGNLIAKRDFTADYVLNSGTSSSDFSTGCTYYAPNRGWRCIDSSYAWNVSQVSHGYPFYRMLRGQYNGSAPTAEIWFYGTGFELMTRNATDQGIHTLELDGSNDFSSYTIHESESNFTDSTGKLDGYNSSTIYYKLGVTGLTLGFHKLKITQLQEDNASASNSYYCDIVAFGVIGGSACTTEPLQSLQQICSAVAGDSLDLRTISNLPTEARHCSATEITGSPTITNTSPTPAIDGTVILKTKGNSVLVTAHLTISQSSNTAVNRLKLFCNGKVVAGDDDFYLVCSNTASFGRIMSFSKVVQVVPGINEFTVHLYSNVGTITKRWCELTVTELSGV